MRLGLESHSAEELTQEVMLTLWHRAETFDPKQASAATWIFAIARNRRIDSLRRQRHPELDPDDPALVPPPTETAEQLMEMAQDNARLHEALKELPGEQSELLKMAFFEDKTHMEIADSCNLPLGTVKSRLRLALARLRRHLGGQVAEA